MDNLWNSRVHAYYGDILQALGHYFTWINTIMGQITQELAEIRTDRMGQLQISPILPSQLKPMPILAQENEMLEASLTQLRNTNSQLEKENNNLKTQLKQKGKAEEMAGQFLKKEFSQQ